MGQRSFGGHKDKNVIFNTIRLNVFNGSVAEYRQRKSQ